MQSFQHPEVFFKALTQTSKYQDKYEFYVVHQKSPLFLGPCCGQTNGPFLAFNGSN